MTSNATSTTTNNETEHTSSAPIIVGIAGGTGAGKTTFAKSIYSALGGSEWDNNNNNGSNTDTSNTNANANDAIVHLSHDDYYKDLSHIPLLSTRAATNFDHPSSLDTDLLLQHLLELRAGNSVVVPRYDFTRHCRFKEGEVDGQGRREGRVVRPRRIVLVEGILILGVPELVDLMDLKVFVDAPPDIRLLRRIQRDTIERGRTLPDIHKQYTTTVRPMHNEFVEPSKANADLIVHGYHEEEEESKKRMELAMRVICNHLKMEIGLV